MKEVEFLNAFEAVTSFRARMTLLPRKLCQQKANESTHFQKRPLIFHSSAVAEGWKPLQMEYNWQQGGAFPEQILNLKLKRSKIKPNNLQ